MSRHADNRKNSGFTLVEALAVTAALVILLGLSAVGVARYRDSLKITELDNTAREIYMAAENRAVLLGSGGQLDPLLSRTAALSYGGAAASPRYIRKTDAAAEDLLPAGAVDPTVLEGEFYIVYDLAGSAVTDVFYTEEDGMPDIGDAFAIAGDRTARMRHEPMLGYYGGEAAAREDYTPLPAPEAAVVIRNDERLTVDVTFTLPALAGGSRSCAVEQTVQITCGGQTKALLTTDPAEMAVRSPDAELRSDTSVTYSWVLDALDGPTPAEKEQHFYQLFDPGGAGPDSYGGDFTVTAEITLSAAGHRSARASACGTGNSLFAEGSGGTTARIETLRHLQNLDAGTSKAGGKTAAVQLADILCYGNAAYPHYEFIPIANRDLTAFDGGRNARNGRNEIRNLRVTDASAAGRDGAGLFAGSGGEIRFTGVRLIDADISAASRPAGALIGAAQKGLLAEDIRIVNASVRSGSAPAGGVAGSAAGTAVLTDCRVYWEPEPGQETLRSLLGSDQTEYQYKITGSSAGGLVGSLEQADLHSRGELTVFGSFAASTVRGSSRAGGLVGSAEAVSLTLANSYAACYLAGREAAGLVGHKTAATVLSHCYAAGSIDMSAAEKAAGLCLGDAEIRAGNTYSVVAYANRAPGKTVFKLDESQSGGLFTHTYYLGSPGEFFVLSGGGGFPASSYDEMSSPEFAAALGDAFAFKGYRVSAAGRNTCPYNLQETQSLAAYSFPGLADLPHYGDWQAHFKEASLVYYEEYQDGSRGFSGGNLRQLRSAAVTSDGYAVALPENTGALDVTYTYLEAAEGGVQTVQQTVTYEAADLLPAVRTLPDGTKTELYYLAPLPAHLVTGDRTSQDFYQYLRFEIAPQPPYDGGGFLSGEFFYNPHFAETVRPYISADGAPLLDRTDTQWDTEAPERIHQYIVRTLSPEGSTAGVAVRTPRHLYNLSRYRDYYGSTRRTLAFRQELDLDYQLYTGHGFAGLPRENGFTLQAPIGSLTAPFLGSYDGGCHTVEYVMFDIRDTDSACAGLFGCNGGTLSNIVYRLDPEVPFSRVLGGEAAAFGTLAGVNRGMITNCAAAGVRLRISAGSAALSAGGLVGVNENTITRCAAELASLTVEASGSLPVLAGGLAGRNEAEILHSYAVGRLSAGAEECAVSLCGFVCRNGGTVCNSYAAMDLRSGGADCAVHGFCDPGYGLGSQSGTGFLNRGNFTYRGERFLADYDAGGVRSLTYEELTAPGSVPGMSSVPGAQDFPCPTGVSDKEGRPVHYGLWPVPMDLGSMGVYYWEELCAGGKSTYHVSLLAVDPGEDAAAVKTVSRRCTLSTARNTGGEVLRYGYGFYHADNLPVILDEAGTQDLFYSFGGEAGEPFTKAVCRYLDGAKEADPRHPDRKADEALAALMEGFTFHSFHSFDPERGEGGLYPGCTGADRPNATLTLEQGGRQNVRVTFYLNPHFAGALAVKQPETGDWTAEDGVLFTPDLPGSPRLPGGRENPYGVRSIAQLRLINWNRSTRNTGTVIVPGSADDASAGNFPYLSGSAGGGSYYWTQSYDIRGAEGRVYTPIAAGAPDGWFGGVYDGGGYRIEDVEIQGGPSSCTGLFGFVCGGVLKDITLCSSGGTGTVKHGPTGEGKNAPGLWCAAGALAGMALTHDACGAVRSCAVSGYRIEASVCTNTDFAGVGGLVGISNMPLTGCTAVTDIRLTGISSPSGNLYAGGLAGACGGNVTDCYAGGTVTVDCGQSPGGSDAAGICIGGLTGGSCPASAGFETGAEEPNTLANCYSYVTLPGPADHPAIRGLFVVGGASVRKNCYYLTEETLANLSGGAETVTGTALETDLGESGVTGLTYAQLSGTDAVEGTVGIYGLLTGFRPVSRETGGGTPGKYSYPPASSPELYGVDYPFPTVLVRATEEGERHVHYGRWPRPGETAHHG